MKRFKQHLSLAIPNVLSNLTVPMAGLIDTVLLGHQKTSLPLAGVALAGTIFSFLYWGFAFLRMGTTGLTSTALGSEDREETAAWFFRSFWLAMVLGITMLILSPAISWLSFYMLQGEPLVEAHGLEYFWGRIWGAPAVLGLMTINGWLLGRLLSRHVLVLSVIQNALIIGLDYLFIWKWSLGAGGAGYATALADILTFCFALVLVRFSWGDLPRVSKQDIFKTDSVRRLWQLNSQLFIRSFFLILTITSFTNISAWMGETVVSANGVLLQLLLFCAYFVDGFAFALESLAGVYAGKKHWVEVRAQLKIAILCSTATTSLFAGAFLFFPEQILERMTAHPEVNELSKSLTLYFTLTIFAASFAYIYDGLCAGLTWGRELKISVVTASCVGFLPLALLAIHQESVQTLWLAYFSFSALRSVVLSWLSHKRLRKEYSSSQGKLSS